MPAGGGNGGWHVDQAELKQFLADMRQMEDGKAQLRALKKNLKPAAEPLMSLVRRNASWSTRIPGAVAVRSAFTARKVGVSVYVKSRVAPHARPIEHDGSGGTFMHPVFGHGSTQQAARPFFFQGADAVTPQVQEAVSRAMDEAARSAGFR